jgi:hypothetical protein
MNRGIEQLIKTCNTHIVVTIKLDFSLGEPVIWTWLRMEDGGKREMVMLDPVATGV